MKRINVVAITSLLIVTLLCSVSWAGGQFETGAEMVADAKTRIEEISIEDFKAMLDNKEEYILIDVREPNEYAAGYIPGAMSIPRGVLEFKVTSAVPDRKANIIVYCKSGGRSALAADTLQNLKYKNVKSLAGGWTAWAEAYPDVVETPEGAESASAPKAEETKEEPAEEDCGG